VLVGKAGPAVLDISARESSGRVGQQMQARLHPGHRVDLASQGRDVEGVHHRIRGDPQAQRRPAGKYQLVDDRDSLRGVDEQPLPVLRDHLDLERLDRRIDRPVGVELVRVAP
jgi:hypothetical protein